MDEKNWLLVAGLEIVLLLLAVSLLLNRSCPEVSVSDSLADLHVIYRSIDSPKDIVPVPGPAVPPIIYTSVISLANLGVREKKQKFFNLLLPTVLLSKHKLSRLRQRILNYLHKKQQSEAEQKWLEKQLVLFDADDYRQLLQKTEDHPVSIVMAQAALETGWGESRFFTEANNVFGVWSFNPEEPRVTAGVFRQGKEIFMKKYNSLIESVDDYFLTIARGPYRSFRRERERHDDPFLLINHLTRYSVQRHRYVRRLREVIEKNDLQRYDAFYLDPRYFLK
jgi:Bax protein